MDMFNFNKPIEEFFDKLNPQPIRIIDQNDDNWVSTGYLIPSLSTFSDGLVVGNGDTPVGTFGGKKLLEKLVQNPTHSFFKNNKTKDLTNYKITFFTPQTNLSEIIESWIKSRIAFSIIKTDNSYLILSVRNFLGLIRNMDLSQKISEIPKKKIITYNESDSIGSVINKMFENNVRRLQLEGTDFLLSDRTILEDICGNMDYLKHTTNFLELPSKILSTINPDKVSENMTVSKLAKQLSKQIHPFVVCNDQIITPWDLLMTAYKSK